VKLRFQDNRTARAEIQEGRAAYQTYLVTFNLELWSTGFNDPKVWFRKITRTIFDGYKERAADALIESGSNDGLSDATMVRAAIEKLDQQNMPSFVGDFCIQEGLGYEVVSITEE
jgi:hypothetical protein